MIIKIIGSEKNVQKWLGTSRTPLTRYIQKAIDLGKKGLEPGLEDAPTVHGVITSVKDVDGKDLGDSEFNTADRMYLKGVANEHTMDRLDEIVRPVGLDVRNYMKNSILMVDHMYMSRSAIGQVLELRPEDDGVHFDGWVGDPKKGPLTDIQKDVRSLIAQGILKTVSIGFIPKKIKSPLFNDEGEMVEPAIIEEWEMLELSIVPIPANAGSTFEMRTLEKSFSRHLNKFASLWNNGNVSFETDLKSLNSAGKGAGTSDNNKGAYKMDEKQAQELIEAMKNLVTLSTSTNEMLKRSMELQESTLSKLEEKGGKPKDDEEDDKDKDKKALEDRVKALEEGLTGINETLGKLSESMLKLVEQGE